MIHTLEMSHISMDFPGVKALNQVDFATDNTMAHAVVGANGAGKSTLMKVVTGACPNYTGAILLDHKPVSIKTPKDAKRLGIEVVYQEVDLLIIPYFTVVENILFDQMVNGSDKKFIFRPSKLKKKAAEIVTHLGLSLDLNKLGSECTLAEKQLILIARAFSGHCRFLILDEPTAPLGPKETAILFSAVKELLARDIGVIFISHRLEEVLQICSQITILKDGKLVESIPATQITVQAIVEKMLGRSFTSTIFSHKREIGSKLLEIRNLNDHRKVKNINLDLHAGEILGLTGLVGAGKTELCKALFGASAATWDDGFIKKKKYLCHSPSHAVNQGLVLIPEERRKEGIYVNESIAFNLMSTGKGIPSRFGFIQFSNELEKMHELIKNLGINTLDFKKKVGHLSGGNQQKVVIGKWLNLDADIYIFDEPTKGIDIQAKQDIFELINKLAQAGKGIIYASSELAEIMQLSTRVAVLFDGEIVHETSVFETSEDKLLYYSTGGH